MTLTRRDLLSTLSEEERFLLKHQLSNVPVNIQLGNVRSANSRMFRRSDVVITTPRDSEIPEAANDNFLEMARDIFDLPIPRKPKRKGWKVLFWVISGLVVVFKCYEIVHLIYDHIR